jgi:hypothetical protein
MSWHWLVDAQLVGGRRLLFSALRTTVGKPS